MLGPIMFNIEGSALSAQDKELLAHPAIGGLLLFTRNYENKQQLASLISEIRQIAGDILIAVDHEGGRVQRFRDEFSAIPAMGSLLPMANNQLESAQQLAFHAGALMALDVRGVGIDISFAPVVDINDVSEVIGDRAFSDFPEMVAHLASAFINGMHSVGMRSTVKHFPGHGSVKEDSHIAMPVDNRSAEQIFTKDMQPFKQLMSKGLVDAVMPAHVIYPEIDDKSVGFSPYWLQEILRKQLAFDGVIFSDDLSMQGAASIGGYVERAEAAQQAGCDMLLVCNCQDAVIDVLDNANLAISRKSAARIAAMLANSPVPYQQLTKLDVWQKSRLVLGLD